VRTQQGAEAQTTLVKFVVENETRGDIRVSVSTSPTRPGAKNVDKVTLGAKQRTEGLVPVLGIAQFNKWTVSYVPVPNPNGSAWMAVFYCEVMEIDNDQNNSVRVHVYDTYCVIVLPRGQRCQAQFQKGSPIKQP
jgi:hypothetical protein